jgi:YbbR domain-containing protein
LISEIVLTEAAAVGPLLVHRAFRTKEIMSERQVIPLRRLRQASANLRRFFDTGNIIRFVVSMILAFGVWAWVTYENDPETTRVLGGIPVTIQNLNSEFEVVGDPPTVDVTVQGPQSVITPMEREAVIAYVDMEDIEERGTHELDVQVEIPTDVRVRDLVPEDVSVEIDQMGSRSDVPLTLLEPDDVPQNYQVSSIDVEPESIELQGPQRTLNQVDHAEVEIQIDGRTTSFSDTIEPRIVDANGEELSGLYLEPEEVSVTVTLEMSGQVRRIIPVVVGDDALAPGHELVRTTVLPSDEVVVEGSEDDIAEIFYLTTVPVDISGWEESQIVRDVEIDQTRLPDNVTISHETVHLSVEVRRQVHEREISDLPITIMNDQPGTSITLGADTASIVLEGSRTAVEAVDADDITVFVNVGNADPGEYEIELEVIVPAQVQYSEITPAFVDVLVEEDDNDEANSLRSSRRVS